MTTRSVLIFIISLDILAAVIAVLIGKNPSQHFKEGGFITWLSFVQLLIVAIIAWKVFKQRREGTRLKGWKQPYMLWAIIAFGFLFLAVDEIARIHEGIDKLIHIVFSLQETGLTDRIDDIILGCYGLLGLWVLYLYGEEIKSYKNVFPFLVIGFIFLFIMVVLDLVSEKTDIVSIFIKDPLMSGSFNSWLGIVEEVFKILSEAVFIATFYHCLKITADNRLKQLKVEKL